MNTNAVKTAIRASGLSYTEVGNAIGVSRQRVSQMVKTGRVDPKHCRTLASLSQGAVTVHDLRPDVFGVHFQAPSEAEAG